MHLYSGKQQNVTIRLSDRLLSQASRNPWLICLSLGITLYPIPLCWVADVENTALALLPGGSDISMT